MCLEFFKVLIKKSCCYGYPVTKGGKWQIFWNVIYFVLDKWNISIISKDRRFFQCIQLLAKLRH